MKFTLITNEQSKDGFKLTFDANTPEEVKTCQELAEKLIEKIKSITVKVTNNDY